MILGFAESKLGAKIDEKSIKKSHATSSASWRRFLVDFYRFSAQVGVENQLKMDAKRCRKRDKKKTQQEKQKIAPRSK